MMETMALPMTSEWEKLLASLCHLQQIVPEAVLVGGTAAALYIGHRVSFDHDHVLPDLRDRFDDILEDLEAVAGWKTARINRPVQILGSLDGVETGVRQLHRVKPLETQTVSVGGYEIRVPTLQETLRIKAYLALERNTTRDYLDIVALVDRMGFNAASDALASMDELYPQKDDNPWAVRTQLIKQFADPRPYDLDHVNLAEYRGVQPPFNEWSHITEICCELSETLVNNYAAMLALDASPKAKGAARSLKMRKEAQKKGESSPTPQMPKLKK